MELTKSKQSKESSKENIQSRVCLCTWCCNQCVFAIWIPIKTLYIFDLFGFPDARLAQLSHKQTVLFWLFTTLRFASGSHFRIKTLCWCICVYEKKLCFPCHNFACCKLKNRCREPSKREWERERPLRKGKLLLYNRFASVANAFSVYFRATQPSWAYSLPMWRNFR